MTLSPVAIFTFNRPEHTLNLLQSIVNSKFSKKTKFYIFSDNYKKKGDKKKVKQVRFILNSFKKKINISIIKYKKNKGLYNSVIYGVNKILKKFSKIIVLEDDLVIKKNFFNYMNKSLDYYKNNNKIVQISGYSYPFDYKTNSAYFLTLSSCWGWGIHKKNWVDFINFISKKGNITSVYNELFKLKEMKKNFNFNGTFNYLGILEKQLTSKVSSWGILFYLFCFYKKKLILYPPVSLVKNYGFDGSGHHKSYSSFFNEENKKRKLSKIIYPKQIIVNKKILTKIQFFFINKLSYLSKIKNFFYI